jgi:hypothetical protein
LGADNFSRGMHQDALFSNPTTEIMNSPRLIHRQVHSLRAGLALGMALFGASSALGLFALGSDVQDSKPPTPVPAEKQIKAKESVRKIPDELAWLDEATFGSCGLTKLSGEELKSLSSAFSGRIRKLTTGQQLAKSAIDCMKKNGWEECEVVDWVNIDHQKYLIVRGRLGSTWGTKDIPFGLSEYVLPAGTYWAKRSVVVGGITDLIDEAGGEHTFLFSAWKEL